MCGFAGIISKKNDIESEHLENMRSAIAHRGPDSNGIWIDSGRMIGFCHNRLSIIDITNAGAQPMHSFTHRFVISFNGEIYNHLTLRDEIVREDGAIKFNSTSDTETLLTCFELWGVKKTLQKAVGMFSFALWDNREATLYLGRDRVGEKPLYYGWQGDYFFFGSELKAFKRHPKFVSEVDNYAVAMYFRYSYIPEPRSIYKNIQKLTPGTILKISSSGEATSIIYWSLEDVVNEGLNNPFGGTENEATSKLDVVLNNTISDQQISDVPIGAFLSGGIDSTLVTAIMQSQSNTRINTFTIGFTEKKYNEAGYAKNIAKYLNTNHHEMYLDSKDIISAIPAMSLIYDEPFADSSQLPTYFVSKLAKQSVTVSLSGDGGDEIFGGYNRYAQVSKFLKYPRSIRIFFGKMLGQFSPAQIDAIYDFLKPILPNSIRTSNAGNHYKKIITILNQSNNWDVYQSLVSIFANSQFLLNSSFAENSINHSTQNIFNNKIGIENEMMMADILTYLPDDILCKVDRAAMSVSLETRVPFLDHRVIDFAFTLPLQMKIKAGSGKWILRNLLNKYVPKEFVERPKMGFGLPLDIWMRGLLRDYVDSMLGEQVIKDDEFLNSVSVTKIWQEHLSGKKNHQHVLWNIIMFQAWKKTWL